MRLKVLALIFVLALCFNAWALPAMAAGRGQAEEITATANLSSPSSDSLSALKNGAAYQGVLLPRNGSITIKNTEPAGSLYLQFVRAYKGKWQISAGGKTVSFGNDFLHEFIDISSLFGSPQTVLTLTFPDGAQLGEINIFSEGETPGWVQKWQPPCQKADIMVCPAHSDDEELYFAGVIPDAVARGLKVEVVYFTDEYTNNIARPQEELDSLWAIGVRNYPVAGPFPDIYSESVEKALSLIKSKTSLDEEAVVGFQTELLRRFKPLVVVGHDFNGEYGHGEHRLDAKTLAKALEDAPNPEKFPASAKLYGTWVPLKAYFHLYDKDNTGIVCDFDKPLACFSGKTAFQMSQVAFEYHKSQHIYHTFVDWLYGTPKYSRTKASSIEKYNPEKYGLYHSAVGPDILKNDMFENIAPSAFSNAAGLQNSSSEAATSKPGSNGTVSSYASSQTASSSSRAGAALTTAGPEGSRLPLVIGAVIFVLAAAVTGALMIFLHRRKKRKTKIAQDEEENQSEGNTPEAVGRPNNE